MQGWALAPKQCHIVLTPRPGLAAGIFGRSDSIMLCIRLPGPSWLTCKDKGRSSDSLSSSLKASAAPRQLRAREPRRSEHKLRAGAAASIQFWPPNKTHEDSGHERVLCDVLYCFCVVKICLFGKQLVRGTCVPLSFSHESR